MYVAHRIIPSDWPTTSSFQEICNRTHVSRTPKPEYLIARSQLPSWGPLGFGPIQFLMESWVTIEVGPNPPCNFLLSPLKSRYHLKRMERVRTSKHPSSVASCYLFLALYSVCHLPKIRVFKLAPSLVWKLDVYQWALLLRRIFCRIWWVPCMRAQRPIELVFGNHACSKSDIEFLGMIHQWWWYVLYVYQWYYTRRCLDMFLRLWHGMSVSFLALRVQSVSPTNGYTWFLGLASTT